MISDALYAPHGRHDTITVSAFHVALVLSLLIHAAALFRLLPHLRLNPLELPKLGDATDALVVRLAPPPSPPSPPPVAPVPEAEAPPAHPAPPRIAPARPRSAPPTLALNRPAPVAPPPPATAPPETAPAPPRPPAEGDLASYIAAHRRSAPPADSAPAAPLTDEETARRNRIVAANLKPRTPTFGYDPDKHGGIFQIRHVGYDNAQFVFFGWNRDARHNTMQEIDVRIGDNSDIRLAVVRKMIAIIRENTQEDFLWESSRLGRNVMLSARPQDNAGLEDFLMREFFVNPRVPQ